MNTYPLLPSAGASGRAARPSSTRRTAGTASAIALALGLVTAVPAQAQEDGTAASPVITAVKNVSLECVENAGLTGAVGNASHLTLTPDAVEASYPERVQPGETFTVTLQPGAMMTGEKGTARMKYDIALPQGVEITNLRIVEEGTSLNDAPAAVVQRVDAAGQPDETGEFARIWDGANSVNNGGSENDGWSQGLFGFGVVPRAGLAVQPNQEFRLPKIAFEITAPETPGSVIRTGLRAAGDGVGPVNNTNRNNAISMLASNNGALGSTVAVYCHANDAGRALTNTVIAQGTETTLEHTRPDMELEADADVLPGDKIRFTATVTAGDTPIPEGATVVFYNGEDVIGAAEIDPETGQAVLDYAFATRGEHQVRAQFQEFEERAYDGTVDGVWEQSESAPVTITVSAFGFDIDNPEPVDPEEGDASGSLGSLESLIGEAAGTEGASAEGTGVEGSSGELQWWHKLLIALGALGAVFGIGSQLLPFLSKHR